MQYISEQEIDSIANDTMRALAQEKKVLVTIRSENGETAWEGGINGHFFRIRTDTPVEVPESLYRLIAASRRVTLASDLETRVYRKEGGKRMA